MKYARATAATLAALLVAQVGGAPQAPTDITLWTVPAVPEVGPPPPDWPLAQALRERVGVNLRVTFIPSGNDGTTRLSAAAAANNLPDVFQVQNRDLLYQLIDQGLVAPVADLLPLMPQRTRARYSNPVVTQLATVNGKLYALQEAPQLLRRRGLLVRQDLLDKAGLKAPKTLDEFLNVAKALTKNGVYGFGARIDGKGLGDNFQWVYGAYGVVGDWNLSGDGPLATIKNPNYYQATLYIRKLVEAGVVDPDWPTLKADTFRSRWKQGKYAMFYDDFCAVACVANYSAFDAVNPEGVITPIAPPHGPSGKAALNAYNNGGGLTLVVSKRAMDAGKGPAIAKMLEYFNSGQGYYLAGFGKRDVNFKLNAKSVVTTEGVDPKLAFTATAQQPNTQLRNLAYKGSTPELQARYVEFSTKNGRTINPLEYYQVFNKSPHVDHSAALLLRPAPNQVDIDRYISEGLVQFVLGQRPLNETTWANFVKGLDRLGFSDYEANARKVFLQGGFLK